MAKNQGGSEDRAKVKLRVIDFELEGANASVENSIRQLTQALAVRNPAPVSPAKTITARSPRELSAPDGGDQDLPDEDESGAAESEPEAEISASSKPAKAKRAASKPRAPNYIHDLNMAGSGDVTFKDFAAAKKPKNNNQRHLVAAFWLKEYGGSPTATLDKAYTCYRTVGWPTNLPDWDINFRQQLTNNRFRRVNPGEYAINPIGEDDVRKMDAAE